MAYRLHMNPSRLVIILLAATTLLLAQDKPAQTPPTAALLVLSKGDHTLAMVDPNSRQVLREFPSATILTKSSPPRTAKPLTSRTTVPELTTRSPSSIS